MSALAIDLAPLVPALSMVVAGSSLLRTRSRIAGALMVVSALG